MDQMRYQPNKIQLNKPTSHCAINFFSASFTVYSSSSESSLLLLDESELLLVLLLLLWLLLLLPSELLSPPPLFPRETVTINVTNIAIRTIKTQTTTKITQVVFERFALLRVLLGLVDVSVEVRGICVGFGVGFGVSTGGSVGPVSVFSELAVSDDVG